MKKQALNTIVFTNTIGIPEKFYPKPASAFIPDWYKDMESYIYKEKAPNGRGQTNATIKRCMPVFDAITAGNILTTYTDVYVSQKKAKYADQNYFEKTGKTKFLTKDQIKKKKLKESNPYYEWPSYMPIEFHIIEQAPSHPNNNGHIEYPKWVSPWGIKTPTGYSTLFIPPMHHPSIFTILEGVVDTDTYTSPVNFPFVLKDTSFEGLIPAGTPMAQVIPFKRDSWSMKIGDITDAEKLYKDHILLRTRLFDSYKSQFRATKEYK